MNNIRKDGSFFIKNIFFVVMIFMVSISLMNFQNIITKNVNGVLLFHKVNTLTEIIRNELIFNNQYLELKNYAYIYEENIDNQNYVKLSEIFEDTNNDCGNYFYLVSNSSKNSIEIQYFQRGKLILEQTLVI